MKRGNGNEDHADTSAIITAIAASVFADGIIRGARCQVEGHERADTATPTYCLA
jgi:hypothetical protein